MYLHVKLHEILSQPKAEHRNNPIKVRDYGILLKNAGADISRHKRRYKYKLSHV